MIGSVMDKLCCRRNQKISALKPVAASVAKKKLAPTQFDDSDAGKSTDVGEVSQNDFSDFTDWSDSELRGPATQGLRFQPPTGFQAPPGLENPSPASNWLDRAAQEKTGTRLNPQATVFTPSFAPAASQHNSNPQHLRQSVRQVRHALEVWEAEHLDSAAPTQLNGSVESNTLLALQDALNKLTPQDAAMVRSLLDSKEAEQKPALPQINAPSSMGFKSSLPPRRFDEAFASKPMSRRTFTPFGAKTKAMPFKSSQPAPSKTPKVNDNADDEGESLRTNLRDLAKLDSGLVLMVRKINRLGFDSAAAIEAHFSKFGKIERVMVSHTRDKQTSGNTRLRPATVGFLVFNKAEDVKAVLAQGAEHVINDTCVIASPFESHPIA